MPQPLSSVLPGADGGWDFGGFNSNPASSRPKLAALAMGVVAEWAQLEWAVSELLQCMVGTNPGPATVMYNALSGTVSKNAALKAIADHVLEDWQKPHFEVIMQLIRSSAKGRNRIAHGIWGFMAELPDALLLREPIESSSNSLSHKIHKETGEKYENVSAKDILVYREIDFVSLTQEIAELKLVILHFRTTTMPSLKADPQWVSQFDRTCSLPRYQSALSRIQQRRRDTEKGIG